MEGLKEKHPDYDKAYNEFFTEVAFFEREAHEKLKATLDKITASRLLLVREKAHGVCFETADLSAEKIGASIILLQSVEKLLREEIGALEERLPAEIVSAPESSSILGHA